MPGVAGRGRGRRTMSEMNMVPFIDVMLVLLIIFMVSAPMITTGVVDLPTVGKSKQQPESVLQVIVAQDGTLKFKRDREEAETVPLSRIAEVVKAAQGGNAQTPVVIQADRQVKYDAVVQVMDKLQQAGVARVGLAVKQGSRS
jgi:biopolymer transport protein TolR